MRFFSVWSCTVAAAVALLVFLSSFDTAKAFEGVSVKAPFSSLEEEKEEDAEVGYGDGEGDGYGDVEKKERLITVYDSTAKVYAELDLDEYLYGVLLAEMPASFGNEALKAQAVAGRSLVCYKEKRPYPKEHPASAVCTESGHCMAYLSPEDYATAGGGADFLSRVKAAVDGTSGEVLVFEGEPILAAFHASSYERTESALSVWGRELSYLRSVTSPEHLYPEKVKGLFSEKRLSLSELSRKTGVKPLEEMPVYGGLSGELSYGDSGRVAFLKLWGEELDAKALRSALSLRSTDFRLSFEGDEAVFSVRGHGHGVGMSQYGASIMSELGKDYGEILSHYYPDTLLCSLR